MGEPTNELLGGFPHSEIAGSKPILGLPALIAEYHVLHRLLLPRHPPNALLALDLIQKKSDWLQGTAGSEVPLFWSKVISYYFPAFISEYLKNAWLVYLTWITLSVSKSKPIHGRGKDHCALAVHTKVFH